MFFNETPLHFAAFFGLTSFLITSMEPLKNIFNSICLAYEKTKTKEIKIGLFRF